MNENGEHPEGEDTTSSGSRLGWTHGVHVGKTPGRRRILYDRAQDSVPDDRAKSASDPFYLRIYNPEELQRAIQNLAGASGLDYFDTEDALSSEETLRLRRLRSLAADPRGPWRSMIRGTPGMVERLEAVKAQAPHFAVFIDLVVRAIHVAIATETPVCLPPVLLVGQPGIGKTWTLKQVANAIGSTVEVFPMNMTDSFRVRGLNTAWKGARPGRIAEVLIAAETASPIILLDELDKALAADRMDRPFDVWHSLWERENSAAFSDDYYEIALRCDRVIWIGSANSVDPLPASVRDRLLVLRIPPPESHQVLAIIDGMYAATREKLGGRLAARLTFDVRSALADHPPRQAPRILELGIGFMAAEKRSTLSRADVARAACLAEAEKWPFRQPIGFVPPSYALREGK